MAGVILKHIRKSYDNEAFTIPDFSLEIADKEFIVLVVSVLVREIHSPEHDCGSRRNH